jgi:hypothetical protein
VSKRKEREAVVEGRLGEVDSRENFFSFQQGEMIVCFIVRKMIL